MTSEAEPYSMLEWVTVERARMADGTEFVLGRHGDGWVIRVGARILMSNRMHGSEEALAEIALARVDRPRAVLVGGLGLGYTTRAVLDAVSAETEVTVSELVPELVDWNRRHLGGLANHPLADRRCSVVVGDVFDTLKSSPAAFDVILLDVDNGPQGLTQAKNQRLYSDGGVRACLAALRAKGVLAVWSAGPNAGYRRKLERRAADVEVLSVAARSGSRTRHVVFVAKGRPRPAERRDDDRYADRQIRPPRGFPSPSGT
jgi:spermidine synthase